MPFKPGQSGNPNGRNRVTTQLKRAAKDLLSPHQKQATAAIVECLEDKEPSTKLQAAKIVFEYCFGKPSQGVELTGANGEALNITVTVNKV